MFDNNSFENAVISKKSPTQPYQTLPNLGPLTVSDLNLTNLI